ncbi:MAG: hypothetical protein ACXV8Y_03810 [Acidimicrobiia bacterium]
MIIGAIGGRGRALVDPRGALDVVGDDWTLDWWIGADDRWRVPAREPAVRQTTVGGAPVVETRVRVPGGDAVQRVYGIGGPGDVVVVEIENDSPGAFVVAFAIRGATSIALDGAEVRLDDRVALLLPFPPGRWDVTDLELPAEQCGAQTGPIAPTVFVAGALRAALLYPLSHRNRMRIAVVTGERRPRLDLAQVPDAATAAEGWRRHLERGMRVRGPEPVTTALDLDRTQILLDPEPGPATAAALEDWGFDDEAVWAWEGLSGRDRRLARRRADLARDASPAGRLLAARDRYVRDLDDRIELLTAPPAPGEDLEVLDAPTRHGVVSFAVRWHGEHPALLWELRDAPATVTLTAPALAPGWATTAPAGETLLRPTPAP